MWAQNIALILVVANLTTSSVATDDVSIGRVYANGFSHDTGSNSRSPPGVYQSADLTIWLYVSIGILILVLLAIAVFIYSCLICSCCPAYKYHQRRNQGVVFSTDVPPPYQHLQQPATVIHTAMLSRHPGRVYVQGVSQQLPVRSGYYLNATSAFPETSGGINTSGNATLESLPDYDRVAQHHASSRPVNET